MKFSIAIFGGPNNSQAAISALHYANAVLKKGHSIYRVFFYHDGIHVGNQLIVPPQDEVNINQSWSSFSEQHNIELVVCIASSLRRGVYNHTEAKRYEQSNHALDEQFVLSGLGQLIDAGIEADRLVSFAA